MASQTITRTYDGLTLEFGELKVGFIKRNQAIMDKAGATASTFADVIALMALVYASVRVGMGEHYPGDDAIDDAIGLLSIRDAVSAALGASGFALTVPNVGEATPVEA